MAPQQPCWAFQSGKCKRGADCQFAHVKDPNFKPQPCKYFAEGTCRFGKKCKYSHDASLSTPTQTAAASAQRGVNCANGAPAQQQSTNQPGTNTQAEFYKWRRDLPSDATEARPLHTRLSSFFEQALKLGSGEAGVTQEIVTSLASEGGMVRIAELVNREFDTFHDAVLKNLFRSQIIPFYRLLSYKNVDWSALLEARVANIYTYLFSPNGQRAVSLFKATARYLTIATRAKTTEEERAGIDASLAVFAKVMEINATAQVTEPFKPIVDDLSALLEPHMAGTEPFSRPAYKSLCKIKQRLNIGQAIPTAGGVSNVGTKPTFATSRDLPGQLSDDGPRHDNDHASIRDIKIMPTLEEISASRNEYLPGLDPGEWHIEGLPGLLDRQFRLVREDTIGQLRDAAKFELERLQDPVALAGPKDKRQHGTRTFTYRNLRFEEFGFDDVKGLEFAVSFDQPFDLRGVSENRRARMWEDSNRLGSDALVCLIDVAGAATFLIVSTPPDPAAAKRRTITHELHQKYPRFADTYRACAVVRVVEIHKDTAKQVLSFFDSANRRAQMTLVEFPGVLVPAFQPTLNALQQMSTSLDLPFADLILQDDRNHENGGVVTPPAYATLGGFRFDLKAVLTNGSMSLQVDTNGNPVDFDMKAFKRATPLDSGQAGALVSSLSRGFAITQGPPGTGKSYTGIGLTKVLLDNKAKGELGPLIVVAYTNHALDQLLEHLLDAGVDQIIRVGTRSKSERLTELKLKEVAKRCEKTKTEKSERFRLKGAIISEGHQITGVLSELLNVGWQPSIASYLQRTNPEQHDQLFKLVDEEGFVTVDYQPESRPARWLHGVLYAPATVEGPIRPAEELVESNVQLLSLQERAMLHQHWVSEIKHDLLGRLATAIQSYSDLKNQLDLINTEIDLRALSSANVVGVTTFGLARQLTLLRKLGSKVLISEEAGEILEAHMLTALIPSLEHVILIGDHQQLRPQVKNFALQSESEEGKQYCLDISLFERLVTPLISTVQPLPFCTLETQRRMHPSIAELVRSTLYPRLQDAANVSEYPEISGLRRRLFWLNHEHGENAPETDQHSTSKTNDWEADMTAALVCHLVRQGIYKPSEIAVLTPYLGQLQKLRDRLLGYYEITLSEGDAIELGESADDADDDNDASSSNGANEDQTQKDPNSKLIRGTLMDAVRLSTIDNFQGEEAKVVVISLVRCNEQKKPGFLKTQNRCNVLLSRAKHGMYIIGNAETAATAPIWAKVIELLEPDNIGNKLQLCCPRHPEKLMEASEPDDLFRLAPAGGCEELCSRQLPKCGHACTQHCHSDLIHEDVHCLKDCLRPLKGCKHPCPNYCGDDCPIRCEAIIPDFSITLECSHILKDPPCWQVQQLDKLICKEKVLKDIPGCKHTILLPCFVDVNDPKFVCRAECSASLPCAHRCGEKCSDCNEREEGVITATDHGSCKAPCHRHFKLCSHSCNSTCHDGPCPSCDMPCDVRCAHSHCSKPCSQPCVPCAEEVCSSQCPHQACEMPCAAPCDWVPCSKRCSKLLDCGCQCPSVCSETCPSSLFCQQCASEDVLSRPVDFIEFSEYRDIDLNADPIVVLDCQHFFTARTLDGLMSMKDFYDLDENGLPVSIKSSSTLQFSKKELKNCPDCRGSLRNVARYGRIVRRALLDESTKKFITWSNAEYVPIAQRLMQEQDVLAGSTKDAKLHNRGLRLVGDRDHQIVTIRGKGTLRRYGSIFGARRLILYFLESVREAEQPFQRVRDLVEAVRRKKAGDGVEIVPFDFDQSLLQTRASLLAFALLLRCDLTVISDVIAMRERTPVVPGNNEELVVDLGVNRSDCEMLIEDAQRTSNKVQELEGHVFWARFAALERNASPDEDGITIYGENTPMVRLKHEAISHLDAAETIRHNNPSLTRAVSHEIEPTREMLRDVCFYTPVSNDEMRAVVAAMANEFRGDGHWYYCVNGHPFTVGECGRPTQMSRCPQCGETVGGEHHQVAEGVTQADDIERQFVRTRV